MLAGVPYHFRIIRGASGGPRTGGVGHDAGAGTFYPNQRHGNVENVSGYLPHLRQQPLAHLAALVNDNAAVGLFKHYQVVPEPYLTGIMAGAYCRI